MCRNIIITLFTSANNRRVLVVSKTISTMKHLSKEKKNSNIIYKISVRIFNPYTLFMITHLLEQTKNGEKKHTLYRQNGG